MSIVRIVPQLRTTDLAASIAFYTGRLGFTLAFEHDGFYAGVRAGDQLVHLKLVDEPDPSIAWVAGEGHLHLYLETGDVDAVAERLRASGVPLVRAPHDTAWGTRELVVADDQGHTLYYGQPLTGPGGATPPGTEA